MRFENPNPARTRRDQQAGLQPAPPVGSGAYGRATPALRPDPTGHLLVSVTGHLRCRCTRKHGAAFCISFGATRVDQAVSTEVLQVIQPIGIEAAINAITAQSSQVRDHRRQIELALQQACYESDRARRQYDAVEPENRIVAAELERRWNERLLAVRDLEA